MPAIIEENFTFIVVAVAIIIIFMVAYFTFIRPNRKSKKHNKIDEKDSLLKEDENPHHETFDKTAYLKSTDKSKTTDTQEIVSEEDQKKAKTDKEISERKAYEENESDDGSETAKKTDEDDSKEEKELGKYHVLYRDKDKRWYVKREGSDKTLRVLHTKEEAIAWATIKAINQDTNIVIHNMEGKIEKHGY
ncbi:MAG: DUF2188 domain-containing protein [Candidatus Izimaplasma sp.]|nr:DUF2188 domain-containing protein [Candidatus Izimaplasma bacterium]